MGPAALHERGPLLIVGAVGAVLTCIAALVPGKKDKSETVAA